jgi:hypothetical protein
MRASSRLAAFAGSLLLVARAGAQETKFEATGDVTFRAIGGGTAGASFDHERVLGPVVDLSRDQGGAWGGNLGDNDVVLTVTPAKIFGVGISVALTRKDDRTDIEGLAFGQRLRLTLDGKRFHGRFGACSYDLERQKSGEYYGNVGCFRQAGRSLVTAAFTGKAILRLLGDASATSPPLPQLPLALIAVLPN